MSSHSTDPAAATVAGCGQIHLDVEGPVATLVLDNPPLNLLTMEMRAEIRRVAEELGARDDVRAVVLTAAGDRAFSAGSDIREFPDDPVSGRERAEAEHVAYEALASMPQPTVAALRGHVIGGGLELALACDFRVAADDARFALPELELGVLPCGGGTQRLPRIVGEAMAKEIILLGESFMASEAFALRLVNRVVPTADVDAAARDIAQRLAAKPRLAVQASKRAIDTGIRHGADAGRESEIAQVADLFPSRDAQKRRAAFFEKRNPRFDY